MNTAQDLVIRRAAPADLVSINVVVESCVMAWNLPERVKRLSVGAYRYNPQDLQHLEMTLAELPGGDFVGVAAWEPAATADLPKGRAGLLLHGLYVSPRYQHKGVGSRLIDEALKAVRKHGMHGLLVKAQADAVGFFQSRGFIHLPVENPERDYAHRWWRQL